MQKSVSVLNLTTLETISYNYSCNQRLQAIRRIGAWLLAISYLVLIFVLLWLQCLYLWLIMINCGVLASDSAVA